MKKNVKHARDQIPCSSISQNCVSIERCIRLLNMIHIKSKSEIKKISIGGERGRFWNTSLDCTRTGLLYK